jgi:hypothetical protein
MAAKKKTAKEYLPISAKKSGACGQSSFAACACGEKIKPEPLLRSSDGMHFPVLAGPRCHSEVSLAGASKIVPPPGDE